MIDINGNLFNESIVQISPLDSGFYYGFSVYETMFIKESKVAFFSEHMDRLDFSCTFFQFPYLERSQLKERIINLIEKNNIKNGRLRLIYSPGYYKNILDISNMTSILTFEIINSFSNSIKLCTTSVIKPNPYFLPPGVKISSNLFSLLSFQEAKKKGFDEGIMFIGNNIISEGSYCNLFWLKDNEVFTPNLSCSILDGVTRNKIILAARNLNFEIKEGIYYKNELFSCDSLFISSSTRGLLRVAKLDEIKFHSFHSEITDAIQNEYDKLLSESLSKW